MLCCGFVSHMTVFTDVFPFMFLPHFLFWWQLRMRTRQRYKATEKEVITERQMTRVRNRGKKNSLQKHGF